MVICATAGIAERYSAFNANAHVCESGIDLAAYTLTRPPHDTVNIGWSGRALQQMCAGCLQRDWIGRLVRRHQHAHSLSLFRTMHCSANPPLRPAR